MHGRPGTETDGRVEQARAARESRDEGRDEPEDGGEVREGGLPAVGPPGATNLANTSVRVERLAEFTNVDVTVTSWSTIRVKRNTYSVSSRLIGERVRVRVFEERIEVWHGDRHEFTAERLMGKGHRQINYRHVIASLVRKPGAFER